METIRHYDSAYELLQDEGALDYVEPDLLEYLKTFDAFEGISYYLIDSKTVLFCDSLPGEIVSDCPLEEFLMQISQYYYETV